MTEAGLTRIVRTWQTRLKLDHIDIEIDLVEPCDSPEALASVTPSSVYDMAVIQFAPEWRENSLFQLNRIVVHELLHIMFRDFGNAIRSLSASGVVSAQTEAIWHDNCHDAEEGLIDRLAWRLVELGGEVK